MLFDLTLVTLFECISFWGFLFHAVILLIPLDSSYRVHVLITPRGNAGK